MLFNLVPSKRVNHSRLPLHVEIRLIDGSLVKANAKDIPVEFETTFGKTKVRLSHIRRLMNIAHLQTMRHVMQLNKFRIWCIDGNIIVGAPKSPAYFAVEIDGESHTGGKVGFVDIQVMNVQPNSKQNPDR